MKLLDVPYYKQYTPYTCGPASLRMVLDYYGHRETEEDLAEEMHTDETVGTEREKMATVALKRNLAPSEIIDATIDNVRILFDQGVPTIVRFLDPVLRIDDHYSVVIGVDEKQIVLHDPFNGPSKYYELGKFLMYWPCVYTKGQTCWLLGISKPEHPLPTTHL